MATNRVSPKKGKVVDIPDAVVTIGTPTAGDASVSVAFTASTPATGGLVQKYTAISSPDSITVSGSTSPVVVTGLTNGTAYTFTVAAANATGNGVFSSASASTTPATQTSFESISTVALSSSNGTITFSSIPSTYKHLQIRMFATGSTTADAYIRFNNDSTATYFCHQMRGGGGGTAQGYSYATQNQMVITSNIGQSSTSFSAAVCDVLDYQNTNKNKTIRSLNGYDLNGSGEAIFWSGAWNNSSSAVSRIDIIMSSGTFGSNSHFALYGIKG